MKKIGTSQSDTGILISFLISAASLDITYSIVSSEWLIFLPQIL